jgi:glycosyltransferase involved in cell wall biosynthesis
MGRPKVTVVVRAYNHEAHVSEALESVLMQRVDFPLDVLVGDDCSTDATREIIAGIQRRYPEIITTFFPDAPMGSRGGLLLKALLKRTTGEYVALLDADDFWIREDKLRRQVTVLDASMDCSICFHDTVAFYEDGRRPAWGFSADRQTDSVTIDDLLGARNIITTCSVLYRNRGVEEYPDWLWSVTCIDWALHILNGRCGDIAYLRECMGAYRIHEGGIWSRLTRVEGLSEKLAMLSELLPSLPSRCLDQLEYARSKIRALIAVEHAVPRGDPVVLVISNGDDQLLDLDGRQGRNFPSDEQGFYAGYNPADGAAVIDDLERARAEGAEYLLVPAASRWWLAHYPDLARHLDRECARIWADEDAVIYGLGDRAAA